jgi:hypothetical protein
MTRSAGPGDFASAAATAADMGLFFSGPPPGNGYFAASARAVLCVSKLWAAGRGLTRSGHDAESSVLVTPGLGPGTHQADLLLSDASLDRPRSEMLHSILRVAFQNVLTGPLIYIKLRGTR